MTDDIVREAREARDLAASHYAPNWTEMLRDLEYAAGGDYQWPADIIAARKRERRPVQTFNRLGPYMRQVTGDMRLNPPSITARAMDSGADTDTAKTFTGLIRDIEATSNCPWPYIVAGENAARCGLGWIMVRADYADESVFEQSLCIEAVPNPFAILMDPDAKDPAWQDAMWGFHESYITEAAFKRRFPGASVTGWDADARDQGWWDDARGVRIAEYWRKVPVKRRLVMLPDGRVVDADEIGDTALRDLTAQATQARAQAGLPPFETREREVNSHRIEMRLLSGVEELQDKYDWPGRYLPMVPVRGEEINLGDKIVRHGLIRHARAPQVLYNIQRNALIEAVGMAPKPKWLVTPKQIAGHENVWTEANVTAFAYLPYNPDTEAGSPPQRVAPDLPAANLLQDITLAAGDIESTIGIFRENLGKESNAQSGRAILSRQREGDVGTYLYMDNLQTAVEHVGRILVDMIPRVYDTERQVRTLGEDGSEKFVTVNQTVMTERGPVKVMDLGAGRYDVQASIGPSFSTRREEARESMLAFMQAAPTAMPMVMDLFAKYQDWPGGDEIAARFRRVAIAQGIAKPDPDDKEEIAAAQGAGQQQADPNMVLAQAEMAKAQAAMMKAHTDAKLEAARLQLEAQKVALEVKRLEIEAGKTQAAAAAKAAEVQIKGAVAAHDMRVDSTALAMRAAGQQHDHARDMAQHAMSMSDQAHRQGMDGAQHMLARDDQRFRQSQPPARPNGRA